VDDTTRPRGPWRDPWVWAILALALAVRFAYLVDLRHTPFFAAPQMDALYHDQWARRLAAGDWWGREVFFRAPLYPYFLGVLYALGSGPVAVRVVQFLIGGGTVLLATIIGYRRFGRTAGLVTGAVLAVYGPLVYFEGELLLVVLEAPLNLLALWSVDRALQRGGDRTWLGAGAWAGLAALVRPTVLVVAPVLGVYLLARRRLAGFRATGLYAAGILLVLLPVLVRNYAVGHDVVPVASQGGLNYYLGNHAGADGMAALAAGFRDTWTGGIEDARIQAERAAGHALKPSEISAYWYARARDWMREDPGGFARLQARKLGYFGDGFEIPNNQDYYFFSRLTRIFRTGALLDFRVLGPLALAGLVLGIFRRRLPFAWVGFPLVLSVVIVAFFVCGRFRAPLVPMFALWAGYGISESVALVRARHWLPVGVFAAALVAGGLLVDTDRDGLRARYSPAESHLRLGIHYASHGDPARAETEYRAALEVNPGFADGWNNLGTLYAQQGDLARAREGFERALALQPQHVKALSNLSGLALQQGRAEEAAATARRILATSTEDPTALYNAGVVLGNLGDYASAETAFRRLTAAQPGRVDAALGLARALWAQGRVADAKAVLVAISEDRRTPDIRALLEQLNR